MAQINPEQLARFKIKTAAYKIGIPHENVLTVLPYQKNQHTYEITHDKQHEMPKIYAKAA